MILPGGDAAFDAATSGPSLDKEEGWPEVWVGDEGRFSPSGRLSEPFTSAFPSPFDTVGW